MQVPGRDELEPWGRLGAWLGPGGPWHVNQDCNVVITTIHGEQAIARPGDFVIKEPDGIHHYPCKREIFEASYDALP